MKNAPPNPAYNGETPLTVLLIGGYGAFGTRLARLLTNEPLHVIIAGRSLQKAQALSSKLANEPHAHARFSAARIDRDGDLNAALADIAADVVIDASGPFQQYGDNPYRVVKAAIGCGSHYLDLADDPGFVRGIVECDSAARAAKVVALSGVSTCPALTGAIYRHLARDLAAVSAVTGGIAPSPYSAVGASVIQAIASYAGQPIERTQDGRQAPAYAFTDTRRFTISPPGAEPLKHLKFSLVDVPDVQLLAELIPPPASVWFGASPVPAAFHAAFRLLARGVRHGILQSLRPLAPLMLFAMHNLSWGEHRGGLFLSVNGTTFDNRELTRSWHLIAEGNVGPMTPTLACVATLRRMLGGQAPAVGARAAHRELDLDDFMPLFAGLDIRIGQRQQPAPRDWPLFRRALGAAWPQLPEKVRQLHSPAGSMQLSGRANVVRGKSLLARFAAFVFRFPLSGEHVPVRVCIRAQGEREIWQRDFDGRRFSSTMSLGEGSWAHLICERFGPLRFGIAAVVDGDCLRYVVRRWSIAGIPMPMTLRPTGTTFEAERDGRFTFNVEIRFPLLGHIVTYRGWLEPV